MYLLLHSECFKTFHTTTVYKNLLKSFGVNLHLEIIVVSGKMWKFPKILLPLTGVGHFQIFHFISSLTELHINENYVTALKNQPSLQCDVPQRLKSQQETIRCLKKGRCVEQDTRPIFDDDRTQPFYNHVHMANCIYWLCKGW